MTADANRLTGRAAGAADDGTTSPVQLRVFCDGLERLGYDVAALLAAAGVRRADLDDPDVRVPCVALDRVLGGALAQRRTPNLGARLAAQTPMGTHPLLDYLVVTSDTV
ncbi:MAG TPA: AraC family transcriptional regulator ligand-binding domain-containing protein, partial [Gemmatimonadales bacterium]